MKVKVISLPYIFQVLYVLYFTRPRYQVSVYRTIGPLVFYFAVEICDLLHNVEALLYPPQNVFVDGYTVFTSVRPSIRPSVTFCFLNNLESWMEFHQTLHTHLYLQGKYL